MLTIRNKERDELSFRKFLDSRLIDEWFVVEYGLPKPRMYQIKERLRDGGLKMLTYSNTFGFELLYLASPTAMIAWARGVEKFYTVVVREVVVDRVGPVRHVNK